jgi:hypothetical protein
MFSTVRAVADRKLFGLTEVGRNRKPCGRHAGRRDGKFLVLRAKKALRFGRNPIPIGPVGPAAAIRPRAVRQRKSGASIEAPSG